MRKIIVILLLSLLGMARATGETVIKTSTEVFVIPIETEIDMQAFYHLRSGVRQACEHDADMVVVKLNTFGGALDAADSIRTTLLRLDIPTVAFVDVNAASAGALIALACDSVFMAPAASMGAATVVNGSGEPMPEKYQSYMSALMRATAEHHGRRLDVPGDSLVWRRNPEIAAAMVNPEKALSFTASQAVENGYADGIAVSVDGVMEQLDVPSPHISTYNPDFSDTLLGFLSNAAVRAFLVMLIIGGIYMEMHTPGLGFAAAVALIAAALYFTPMLVTGTLPAWILLTFIAGVVLIALEVFVVPGFGVTGISGIICIAVAMCGALMHSDSVTGVDFGGVASSLMIVGAGALMAIGAILYLTSSRGPKCFRKHSELMTSLSNADGFVGVDMSIKNYVGQEGTAATDLRPAGKIRIGHNTLDAVSTGAYIPSGRRVRAVKYENAQLYVVECSENKTE